MQAEATLL